jgi:hypothetical protein
VTEAEGIWENMLAPDTKSVIENSGSFRRVSVALVLCIYPLTFFARVLFSPDWDRLGDSFSDADHSVFESIGLHSMATPWSRFQGQNFPHGENFWTVPGHVAQGAQWLSIWVINRFFNPIDSITIFVLIGWISTGVVSFLICRQLGMNRSEACFAAVLVQCLPWMTIKAFHHTSFVFLSVPLVAVLLSLKFGKKSSFLLLYWVTITLFVTAFFDPYWFVFATVIFLVAGFFRIGTVARLFADSTVNQRVSYLTFTSSLIFVLVFSFVWGISSISKGSTLRPPNPRGVYGSEEIARWTGQLVQFFTPGPNHLLNVQSSYIVGEGDQIVYGGAVVMALGVLAIFRTYKRSLGYELKLISTLVLVCICLSIDVSSIGGLNFPSFAQILSKWTPGIRVFLRFSAVAQALLCILAVWFISQLRTNSKTQIRKIFGIVVAIIAFLDLAPFAYRPVFAEYEKYSEMRTYLDLQDDVAVLLPDGALVPMELSMRFLPGAIDAPLLNTYSDLWKTQTYPHAYSSEELAEFLLSRNVKHIVAVVDENGIPFISGKIQDATRFTTDLDPKWFKLRTRIVRMSTGQDVGLYEVVAPREVSSCVGCTLGQMTLKPSPFVESEFDYVRWVTDLQWFSSPSVEITPEPIPDLSSSNPTKFQVDLRLQIYPGARDTRLIIRGPSSSSEISLTSGESQDLRLIVPAGEKLTIKSSDCFRPTDIDPASSNSQSYCFAISEFRVLAIS